MTCFYGPETVATRRCEHGKLGDDFCATCAGMETCERCDGSGTIGCSTSYPCSYIGPGPMPEHARHVYEARCDECGGLGYVPVECRGDA